MTFLSSILNTSAVVLTLYLSTKIIFFIEKCPFSDFKRCPYNSFKGKDVKDQGINLDETTKEILMDKLVLNSDDTDTEEEIVLTKKDTNFKKLFDKLI